MPILCIGTYNSTALTHRYINIYFNRITSFLGEQQKWANPNPELKLVQKVDPLARKPYKLQSLVNQFADDDKNMSTDKTSLVESKYSHGYGTNVEMLNSHLSKTLQEK